MRKINISILNVPLNQSKKPRRITVVVSENITNNQSYSIIGGLFDESITSIAVSIVYPTTYQTFDLYFLSNVSYYVKADIYINNEFRNNVVTPSVVFIDDNDYETKFITIY